MKMGWPLFRGYFVLTGILAHIWLVAVPLRTLILEGMAYAEQMGWITR